MGKYLDVGRSPRTPAKHALMASIVGKELAAGYIPGVRRMTWLDLTAGDGVVPDGLKWKNLLGRVNPQLPGMKLLDEYPIVGDA